MSGFAIPQGADAAAKSGAYKAFLACILEISRKWAFRGAAESALAECA
jgi:hypothetical protein